MPAAPRVCTQQASTGIHTQLASAGRCLQTRRPRHVIHCVQHKVHHIALTHQDPGAGKPGTDTSQPAAAPETANLISPVQVSDEDGVVNAASSLTGQRLSALTRREAVQAGFAAVAAAVAASAAAASAVVVRRCMGNTLWKFRQDDRSVQERCIFCKIVASSDEPGSRVLYQNERLIVIPDIRPSGIRHLLVIPRTHIANTDSILPGDFELLQEMLQTGKEVLHSQIQQDDSSIVSLHTKFGYHMPPFRSVDHLHQHCFQLPHTPWWKVIKYSLPFVWLPADKLIGRTATAVSSTHSFTARTAQLPAQVYTQFPAGGPAMHRHKQSQYASDAEDLV